MSISKRIIIVITAVFLLLPALSACGANAPASTTQKILSAPVGITIIASGSQNILKWLPVQGAISYNVYSSTAAKFSIKNASVSNTILSALSIASQGKYYKVTAVDNDGNESTSSAEVNDITLVPPPPPALSVAYVVNSGDNTVSVIDLNTYATIKTIPVGSGANYIDINSNTKKAYVTNYADNSISVIDTTTNTVVSTIVGVMTPVMIKINPLTNSLYTVSNYNPYLTVVNGNTNTVTASILCGQWTRGVALDTQTNMAYVTNTVSNDISVVDMLTNTVSSTIPLGPNPQPQGIGIDIGAKKVYTINHAASTVSVIDTTTNAIVATIPTGSYPSSIIINPVLKRAYITNTWTSGLGVTPTSDTITVADTVTNQVIATITVGERPLSGTYNPINNLVYITNCMSNNVSVIDPKTNTTIATFPVGRVPVGIAVIP